MPASGTADVMAQQTAERTSRAGVSVETDVAPFADRTCLVTGASRGIGRAIATTLGSAGATVVANYRSSAAAAEEVAQVVEAAGGEATAVQADVTDPDAVAAMREQVHAEYGPVDVVVNNAGVTDDAAFEDMTHEQWARVVDVNLGGAFTTTKAFYEDVRTAHHGRVVTVASVVGKQGNYGQVNYAAAKAGLFGFTRALALELAPDGSTANCVAPGFTSTDMVDAVPEGVKEELREETPLGRFAEPREIANVVRFLASHGAQYVTGEVVDATGGFDL
jgi:3-oxoacyl-[acyl-carrier protein] reductase